MQLQFRGRTMPAIARDVLPYVSEAVREQTSLGSDQDAAPSSYDKLSLIERRLHAYIRNALVAEYGDEDEAWWRRGVPLEIRRAAAQRREDDDHPTHQYHYVDLIDFRTIIDREWRVLGPALQPAGECFPGKRDWLDGLNQLNRIRRKVMHPARGDDINSEECDLLERFHEAVRLLPAGEATEVAEEREEAMPEWKRKVLELIGEDDDGEGTELEEEE